MNSSALLKPGLFVLVVLSVAWAASDQPEVTWIRDNAVKLQTVEAGHGLDDMQPLKKIIGDARIVSLGEATHGTREFFQLKHRMLEFLATNMGFTIFSIEASMPVAYRLNDFVLNGKGDPARLIKGMYVWPWDTQEVLDMVLWMREFARSGKGRLQFTGFDMQTPNAAAGIVNDFVAGADPDYVAAVRQAIDMAQNAYPAASDKATGTQRLHMTPVVQTNDTKAVAKIASSTWTDVVRHLETSREAYQKKGAASYDIEWATQNARVILQYMQMRANEATRDKSMADNVKWILDNNPGAKIVLWAHNGHVSTASSGGYDPMGALLRRMYGPQIVVFGFAFNQGSFQARDQGKELRDFSVPPAPDGSFDATLAAAGIPLFALDLRAAPKTGPVSTWLSEPHKMRIIGASFSEASAAQNLMAMTASECFDVMLFVEKTTAARSLE